MALNAGKILKISITLDSKEKILEYVQKYLAKNSKLETLSPQLAVKPLVIVTPNPEQMMYARQKPSFARVLNRADVALPDGIGIVWAYRMLHPQRMGDTVSKTIQRIPGIEFMQTLVGIASQRSYRIGLIGGRGGLAVKAFECLRLQQPGLNGWAQDGPEVNIEQGDVLRITYYGKNADYSPVIPNTKSLIRSQKITEAYFTDLAQRITRTQTQMVFVGLGAPKQEYFIDRLRQELSGQRVILMAVGGSFDIITGRLSRAPLVFRLWGFEWLWRLVREPWRWRRQLALVKFVFLVLKEKIQTV